MARIKIRLLSRRHWEGSLTTFTLYINNNHLVVCVRMIRACVYCPANSLTAYTLDQLMALGPSNPILYKVVNIIVVVIFPSLCMLFDYSYIYILNFRNLI